MASVVNASATRLLGREVQVGKVAFSWFYPTFQVSDISIAGPGEDSLPVVTARQISVDIALKNLLNRRVVLDRVEIVEPSLIVEFSETGEHNLPRLVPSDGSGWLENGSWSVEVGKVTIERGAVHVGRKEIPLDLQARNLRARFVEDSSGALEVNINAHDVEVALPESRPYVGTVEVRGRLAGSTFELLSARVSGPFLTSVMNGQVRWHDHLSVQITSVTEIDTELLRSLAVVDDQVEGSFRLNGEFVWEENQWSFMGDFDAESTTLLDWLFWSIMNLFSMSFT